MSYVADRETQIRKLRAVRAAVASALGNGVPESEVFRQVEAGVADIIREREVRQGRRPSQAPASSSGALADLERAVGF